MALKINKLDKNIRPENLDLVKVKEMGNIIEIMHSKKRNNKLPFQRLDDNTYMNIYTGEIKEFKRIENRACDLNGVRISLGKLRDLLNTNITDVKKCKWVTLTYAENMTDPSKLKKDFEKFNKRMQYYLKDNPYEYIVAMEPQGRGAWHAHLVMIFQNNAPYIDNKIMSEKWGHGYTTTKKLDDVDNVGAYLTAYLGDMDINDLKDMDDEELIGLNGFGIKDIETEIDGKKVSKKIIKGGRLHMYPPKFNIYRCSKGIKKPIVSYELEINAQKKASAGTLTFEKTIKLADSDSNFENIINYRHYNLVREEKQ